MSKPMACSMPRCRARRPAAIMPATGPDSIIDTGCERGVREAHHAAVGAHQMQPAAEAAALQIAFERAQIARHARADIGVEHGRRGALVLAELAQDLVAERDEHAGQRAPQHFAGAAARDRDWPRSAAGRRRRPRCRAPSGARASAATSASSSGVSTLPSARTRSATSNVMSRGTSGFGRWKSRLNASMRLPRPIA